MVCFVQSSPSFGECFVIHAERNKNDMRFFNYVEAFILVNFVYWFVLESVIPINKNDRICPMINHLHH